MELEKNKKRNKNRALGQPTRSAPAAQSIRPGWGKFYPAPCDIDVHCLAGLTVYLGFGAVDAMAASLPFQTDRTPMSSFDKRGDAYENKFALDESQKFKAEARRNKLLGLWVADKLGLAGDDAAAYAKEVVAADFEEAGDADVVRKVLADLTAKSVALTEPQLRVRMDELMAAAILQVKAGT
jgi:hypothetical protein